MPRLFVALDLPDAVKDDLVDLSEEELPGARWSGFDRFHLTLCFIGEVSNRQAQDIDESLASIRHDRFTLQLSGTGFFGDKRRARILWAGVKADPALGQLHQKIIRVLKSLEIDMDARKFRPHITLARCKGMSRQMAEDYASRHINFRSEPFTVSQFHLYSSRLASEGAHYRIEADYPLSNERAEYESEHHDAL